MLTADTRQFQEAAKALNEAADAGIRRRVYRGFRAAATPLGAEVVRALAAEMPRRGGLSDKVAGARVSVRNATTGRYPGVAIHLRGVPDKAGKAMDLTSLNRGVDRHPVFGKAWTTQTVPAGAATTAFNAGAPRVRRELLSELQGVAREVGGKIR